MEYVISVITILPIFDGIYYDYVNNTEDVEWKINFPKTIKLL
jgi:hypothetical protein